MRARFTLFLLPLALLLVGATPKQPDIPRLGEVIEVSIVNVDVFVTDKQGNRVRGLSKDDFEIFEDGKPQPITNFSDYGPVVTNERAGVGLPAGAAVAQSPPPQKRTMILFVDRFFLPSFNRDPLFARLKEMLHKTVRPGDAAMIVSWNQGLHVRQPFTDDMAALDRSLDRIAYESGLPQPDLYTQNLNAGSARLGLRIDMQHALWEVKQKINAMNALITTISGVEGRRVLLYASHRMGRIAGGENLYVNGNPNFSTDVRASLRPSEFDTTLFVQMLTKNANANGVTIYPVYPEGLGNDSLPGSDKNVSGSSTYDYDVLNNETLVLDEIAKQTGGQTAFGPDIIKLLPHIEEDFESYYSLAYRTTTSNQNRAHQIVVRTRSHELTVRSRRELVEKSDQSKMNDRVVANLFQPPGGSIIPVKVAIGRHTPARGKYTVPISVRIPIAGLTTVPQDNTNAGAFSVYVTSSSSSRGTIGDVTHRTQRYDIPPNQVKKARDGFFTYDLQVLVDGGVDRLSVGVLDEVSREFGLTAVDLPTAMAGSKKGG